MLPLIIKRPSPPPNHQTPFPSLIIKRPAPPLSPSLRLFRTRSLSLLQDPPVSRQGAHPSLSHFASPPPPPNHPHPYPIQALPLNPAHPVPAAPPPPTPRGGSPPPVRRGWEPSPQPPFRGFAAPSASPLRALAAGDAPPATLMSPRTLSAQGRPGPGRAGMDLVLVDRERENGINASSFVFMEPPAGGTTIASRPATSATHSEAGGTLKRTPRDGHAPGGGGSGGGGGGGGRGGKGGASLREPPRGPPTPPGLAAFRPGLPTPRASGPAAAPALAPPPGQPLIYHSNPRTPSSSSAAAAAAVAAASWPTPRRAEGAAAARGAESLTVSAASVATAAGAGWGGGGFASGAAAELAARIESELFPWASAAGGMPGDTPAAPPGLALAALALAEPSPRPYDSGRIARPRESGMGRGGAPGLRAAETPRETPRPPQHQAAGGMSRGARSAVPRLRSMPADGSGSGGRE
jgi:hypothetical protein